MSPLLLSTPPLSTPPTPPAAAPVPPAARADEPAAQASAAGPSFDQLQAEIRRMLGGANAA